MVVGMGEALVGNYPGRALSFAQGAGGGEPQLLGLPSKREGLFAGAHGASHLIARSDSNGGCQLCVSVSGSAREAAERCLWPCDWALPGRVGLCMHR